MQKKINVLKTLIFLLFLALVNLFIPVNASEDLTRIYPVRFNLPALKFKLNGPKDQTITEKDVKGKVVLVYFGYTFCPDICPTTMAELALMKDNYLKKYKDQIQTIFISVDPYRDTAKRLETYVKLFDDHALGLTGDAKAIADIARRYRVAYQIEKPKKDNPNYIVRHAEGIYIFDTRGKARFLASNSHDQQQLAEKIITLFD